MSKIKESPSTEKQLPASFIYVNAGLSGMMATCVVHPMNVIKNQMQISKKSLSISKTVSSIIKNEGILKMYAGLSAGLVRQATYTTIRLGIFNQLYEMFNKKYENQKPSFPTLILMAATAGGSGAFFGTPAEVALVRMSSDGRLPADQRRNYRNVFDAFMRIVKEEGITTLWKGVFPTIIRSVIVNVSQLVTYTQAKNVIAYKLDLPDGFLLYFPAAMISGFVTALNSMPFDVAKTRIQNLPTSKRKTPGLVVVMISICKKEGVKALWKGFVPTYCRIGPHTVITFLFNEKLTRLYKEHFMD